MRLCLDYRKLSAVTVKDSSSSQDQQSTGGSAMFSTMDLQHGHWQVELEESYREKTAFTTGNWLNHFKVMPMGPTNAPATCQCLMEIVLHGLQWKTCLVYLEDVLIYSLQWTSPTLGRHSFQISVKWSEAKPLKMLFWQRSGKFFGLCCYSNTEFS